MTQRRKKHTDATGEIITGYDTVLIGMIELLESTRRTSIRTVNALMTATYWEIGRRIVEFEQEGKERAAYGKALLKRLSSDLTGKFRRGFSERNLEQMRLFYLEWPIGIRYTVSDESGNASIEPSEKSQTASAKSLSEEFSEKNRTPLEPFDPTLMVKHFPLPWSHYVALMKVKNADARTFYETEAIRGGWSVRQLDRQISTQFYERTALSRNKAAMLAKGAKTRSEELVTPEEEIKDPFVLEFLGLKDEYSEHELEEALIRHLESFLLELGGDFAFIGRQRRLRVGDEWYRVDLVFFHRLLRCLVIIDLKLGKFTHADAGQMHMYLNYARENWTHADENPPVGLILCTQKDEAVAHYALEGLPNKVIAAEYRTTLPNEETLADEMERTRKMLEGRRITRDNMKPEK